MPKEERLRNKNGKFTTPEKLTQEEKLGKLQSRLDVAKAWEKSERDQWEKVINAVELKREVTTQGETSVKQIKYPLVYGAYDHYQSSLGALPPQTVISSDDPNDHIKSLYWKGILDYQKRKILFYEDKKYEFIQSFIVTGKAAYKIGRQVATTVVKDEVKHTTKDGQILTQKAEREEITENKSFMYVVDPRRLWISPETRYQGPVLGEECPYIIEEMIKAPEYLEVKYGVTIGDSEKENITINEDTDQTLKLETLADKDDIKRVRLYAYYGEWEVDGKLYPNCEVLFTKNQIVQERKLPYDHGKKPYIYLLNHRKFFKAKAMGLLDAIMDLDQEYNEHMNRIRTYIRRMVNPKWAKLKGTKVDEAALLDPDIGVIVDESQPNAIRPLVPPQINQEIFEKATATEKLFQFLTSITYGQTALKDVGTATGQEIAERGADVKIGRMIKLLERAHEEADTMILQLEQQFASNEENQNLKILGSDIVEMVKNKKKLYQMKTELFQRQQQRIQPMPDGQNGQPAGFMPPQVGTPIEPLDEPIDDYENFQISDDGKSVFTTYKQDDIKGDFELYIVSQSSNRNNQAVRSNQILKAIELSANDQTVNRGELWKTWFTLNGETDTDRLVMSGQPQVPMLPGEAAPDMGGNGLKPSAANMAGGVKAAARQTV